MSEQWYTTIYRRAVIDQHITDINADFLTDFDAERYVGMISSDDIPEEYRMLLEHFKLLRT